MRQPRLLEASLDRHIAAKFLPQSLPELLLSTGAMQGPERRPSLIAKLLSALRGLTTKKP